MTNDIKFSKPAVALRGLRSLKLKPRGSMNYPGDTPMTKIELPGCTLYWPHRKTPRDLTCYRTVREFDYQKEGGELTRAAVLFVCEHNKISEILDRLEAGDQTTAQIAMDCHEGSGFRVLNYSWEYRRPFLEIHPEERGPVTARAYAEEDAASEHWLALRDALLDSDLSTKWLISAGRPEQMRIRVCCVRGMIEVNIASAMTASELLNELAPWIEQGGFRHPIISALEQEADADRLLDPSTPMAEVEETLREFGLDPEEVGKRGAEVAAEALAQVKASPDDIRTNETQVANALRMFVKSSERIAKQRAEVGKALVGEARALVLLELALIEVGVARLYELHKHPSAQNVYKDAPMGVHAFAAAPRSEVAEMLEAAVVARSCPVSPDGLREEDAIRMLAESSARVDAQREAVRLACAGKPRSLGLLEQSARIAGVADVYGFCTMLALDEEWLRSVGWL